MANTNLNLIDPNAAISELPAYMNGTPDYEKMYMFVELTASRKSRTVLQTSSNGVGTHRQRNGLEEDVTISMMGYDQTTDNKEHTTRYSFNTSVADEAYEGFGIQNIQIQTNSSYVPKVNIDFMDVRGSSFAQSEDSIYHILFDFPPPIYKLTIKGYYGRALTYELHLVKYNIKFAAKDGSFLVAAEFVARTFAPLTDLLFKYVETFPLIVDGTAIRTKPTDTQNGIDDYDNLATANSNIELRPKNTYELIKKIESLYDKISDARDTSEESKDYNRAKTEKEEIDDFTKKLSNFGNAYEVDPTLRDKGVFLNRNEKNIDSINNLKATTLREYNGFLSSTGEEGTSDDSVQKLLIAYPVGVINDDGLLDFSFTNDAHLKISSTELVKLRENILSDASKIDNNTFTTSKNNRTIVPSVVNEATYGTLISDDEFNDAGIRTIYNTIDITIFYSKIYKMAGKAGDNIESTKNIWVGKINEIVRKELGMIPTIYNIFEIICDDVDRFFEELKSTSIAAETHHEKFNELIVTSQDNGIKDDTITAFPLFVSGDTVSNVKRKERRMPTAENIGQQNSMSEFPEALLVNRFMETFISIEKDKRATNMKTQQDVRGNNKWIPVTPADSSLYSDVDDNSPYYSIFGTTTNSVKEIFEIYLNRFYIQSQFTYAYDFYSDGNGNPTEAVYGIPKELRKFLASAEAINIGQSLTERNIIQSIQHKIGEFENNIDNFYTFLEENNISNYSKIEHDEYLSLTNNTNLYRDRDAYVEDYPNSGYTGIKLITSEAEISKDVILRRTDDSNPETANPVDKYVISAQTTNWLEKIGAFLGGGFSIDKEKYSQFTKQNLSYFPDVPKDDNYSSFYLAFRSSERFSISQKSTFDGILTSDKTDDTKINECAVLSESVIDDMNSNYNSKKRNFIDAWSNKLADYEVDIHAFFAPSEDEATNIIQDTILTSNLLRTMGHFNNYSNINEMMKYPAAIEHPYYLALYMGGLVKISQSSILKEKLIDFINSDLGVNLRTYYDSASQPNRPDASYILYDLKKIELLAQNDQNTFQNSFDSFNSNESREIKDDIRSLIGKISGNTYIAETFPITISARRKRIDAYVLELKNGYKTIPNSLARKIVCLNMGQLTFNKGSDIIPTTYEPLKETITDLRKKDILDKYFIKFIKELKISLKDTDEDLKNLEDKFRSNVEDNDIKTQTYYSFKNMNDKWIAGQNNGGVYGFPFNFDTNDRLINKFSFVDRAMNPIGDEVIINAEPLVDMVKDYDLSVFTVLSRLLSYNGFEFFPLQNFMSYEESEWADSFKMFESVENQLATPSFVCMYIGGTSSYLSLGEGAAFKDDGLDFNNMGDVEDFTALGDQNVKEVARKRLIDGKKYPYSEVRAFRVRYGEQNQSVFTDINIDSREYPETNESLAILSKIAQDESTSSPVPKGQNLYNTYETRAYTAKISMLGDAMIQPTQYFQLENVPIFSGAYVILDVEHNIVPNKMTTTFSGVKILKYPNPFVREYATMIGLNSGTSEDLSATSTARKSVYGDGGADTLPISAQHNALFTLKFKPEPIDQSE